MFFEAKNMSGTDICKLVFVLTTDIWSSCFKIFIKWNHDWLLQYFLLRTIYFCAFFFLDFLLFFNDQLLYQVAVMLEN